MLDLREKLASDQSIKRQQHQIRKRADAILFRLQIAESVPLGIILASDPGLSQKTALVRWLASEMGLQDDDAIAKALVEKIDNFLC